MANIPLNTAASVKLDGGGGGTASVGPEVGQKWVLGNLAVSVSSAVLEPTCNVYHTSVAPENLIDGTYTGSRDSTDSGKGLVLTAGQKVFAVWAGGDANARATLSVFGTVVT